MTRKLDRPIERVSNMFGHLPVLPPHVSDFEIIREYIFPQVGVSGLLKVYSGYQKENIVQKLEQLVQGHSTIFFALCHLMAKE